MVLFACYSRTDIPKDLINYPRKELEKIYVQIVRNLSHESSRADCDFYLQKCSIGNLKTLISLGFYGLQNTRLSVINKTNIVQMFVVISKIRDYNCLLLHNYGIIKILYRFALVLKTRRLYCFKKTTPLEEAIRFSEYVVNVIEELSNTNSYCSLVEDGIPLNVKKLSDSAKKVKAKLVKKGVKFTLGSWDMPFHRNESLNTLGGSNELFVLKTLSERARDLQEKIQSIESEMAANVLDSEGPVHETVISDLISSLSLYEFKTQNLIQESVDSESMHSYEELMNLLDYIKHLINTLKGKMCTSLDPHYVENNLPDVVDFDPFINEPTDQVDNENEQISHEHSDVSTEFTDDQLDHNTISTNPILPDYQPSQPDELDQLDSSSGLQNQFDQLSQSVDNLGYPTQIAKPGLTEPKSVDELVEPIFEKKLSYDKYPSKDVFSHSQSLTQSHSEDNSKQSKLYSSLTEDLFENLQHSQKQFTVSTEDLFVKEPDSREVNKNKISNVEQVDLEVEESRLEPKVKEEEDMTSLYKDMSYVMDTLKRINSYLESKPPKFVANSKNYQSLQSTISTYYDQKEISFENDKSQESDDHVDKVREQVFDKDLFGKIDDNLYQRLSDIYQPKKTNTFSPNLIPYDNSLITSSITSQHLIPSYPIHSVNNFSTVNTHYYTVNLENPESRNNVDSKGIYNNHKKDEMVFKKGIPSDDFRNKMIRELQILNQPSVKREFPEFSDKTLNFEEEVSTSEMDESEPNTPQFENNSKPDAEPENEPHIEQTPEPEVDNNLKDNSVNEYGYPVLEFNNDNEMESSNDIFPEELEDRSEEYENDDNYHKVNYAKFKSNEEISEFNSDSKPELSDLSQKEVEKESESSDEMRNKKLRRKERKKRFNSGDHSMDKKEKHKRRDREVEENRKKDKDKNYRKKRSEKKKSHRNKTYPMNFENDYDTHYYYPHRDMYEFDQNYNLYYSPLEETSNFERYNMNYYPNSRVVYRQTHEPVNCVSQPSPDDNTLDKGEGVDNRSKIVELSSSNMTDDDLNTGKYVKIMDDKKLVKRFKVQENSINGEEVENKVREKRSNQDESNSSLVKKAIKYGGDEIFKNDLLSIKFNNYTRHEPVLYTENTLTIENNSVFSFSISLDYSNFDNFPINLKFLNKEFKNLSLTPGSKISQYFSTHCYGPFIGLPKLSLTAHVDAKTDKLYQIYLPIAISSFFLPTLDVNTLSQSYFNSDKFRHIMKNKVYFNAPKRVTMSELLTVFTTFGKFKILQQAENCFYLASTFSAPFYFNSRELYKFTIFAMVEISNTHYNVHVSSDSYRLANSTCMLFKYILQP